MAKVTIVIEDAPNNMVRCVAEPSFETMINKHLSGSELTAAEAYAFRALRVIREEGKKAGPAKILIPKIGRS